MKVLIADKLSPKAVEIFEQTPGIDVDVKVGLSKNELLEIIGEYDGLAIRSATKVTDEVILAADKLKVIGRAGIGVDNVDIAEATAKGIVVMNTPFGNSVTTAEHAIGLLFASARRIPQANQSTHEGKWEKSKFMGVELTNKTLGLIGCGNIGSIVSSRALGLKMHVIAYDPFLTPERAADLNITKVELDELLAKADFITLHTPLNDQTRGILNKTSLQKTKKGVRIVNCARGGLIVEADLKAAIESGHVAGAALDVFEEEPARDNVLFGMEEVICTPHLGASTQEAQENVAVQVAEQMSAYLTKGEVCNALNIPSVSSEDAKKLSPYITLAEHLGSFAGQITETGIESIKIEYEGKVTELNTKPLTAVLLRGVLAPLTSTVNMVNAPVVAKERNIDVSEVKNERSSDYHSLIRLTVTTETQERDVAGTLFGGNKPRLVEVKGVNLESGFTENMLYVTNKDEPGLVGALGNLLAAKGVNIANFHLGRNGSPDNAMALLELDQQIDNAVLEDVAALPQVIQAKRLNF